MKKTLVALFTLVALSIGVQSFAACPCENPCPCPVAQPCCPVVQPCCPAAPVAEPCCPCQPSCNCCGDDCGTACKKKCSWWKIFEDKCCCVKCNSGCPGCGIAKRCHWWQIWKDRCVLPAPKGNNCGCCN